MRNFGQVLARSTMALVVAVLAASSSASACTVDFTEVVYEMSHDLDDVTRAIGTVEAVPGDSTAFESVTYAITEGQNFGAGLDAVANAFTIDPASGEITAVGSLPVVGGLSHKITVRATATCAGGVTATGSVAVAARLHQAGPCSIAQVEVGVAGPTCATSNTGGGVFCWGNCGADGSQCGLRDSPYLSSNGRVTEPEISGAFEGLTPRSFEAAARKVTSITSATGSRVASCALMGDKIRCWGNGDYLPYPSGDDVPSPADAPNYPYNLATSSDDVNGRFTDIEAGESAFCATRRGGSSMICWGATGGNQLGAVIDSAVTPFSHGYLETVLGTSSRLQIDGLALGDGFACGQDDLRNFRDNIFCIGRSPWGSASGGRRRVANLLGSAASAIQVRDVSASKNRMCAVLFDRSVRCLTQVGQGLELSIFRGLTGDPNSIAAVDSGFCVATAGTAGSSTVQCAVNASSRASPGDEEEFSVKLLPGIAQSGHSASYVSFIDKMQTRRRSSAADHIYGFIEPFRSLLILRVQDFNVLELTTDLSNRRRGRGQIRASDFGDSDDAANQFGADTVVEDLDGDGLDDIIAGAPGLGNGGVYAAVLPADILTISTATSYYKYHTEASVVAAMGTGTGQRFGQGVCIIEHGASDFWVAAGGPSGIDSSGAASGAVVIFNVDRATQTPSAAVRIGAGQGGLSVSGLKAGHRFGRSVASMGDMDGDGIHDIAVGAPGHGSNDDASANPGAVILLTLTSARTVKASRVLLPGVTAGLPQLSAGSFFGASLARAGCSSVNGDAHEDLLVRVQLNPNGGFVAVFMPPSPMTDALPAPGSRYFQGAETSLGRVQTGPSQLLCKPRGVNKARVYAGWYKRPGYFIDIEGGSESPYQDMQSYDQRAVQLTTDGTVERLSGAGCQFCGLVNNPGMQKSVSCFGCDGYSYTYSGANVTGGLGYGFGVSTVGGPSLAQPAIAYGPVDLKAKVCSSVQAPVFTKSGLPRITVEEGSSSGWTTIHNNVVASGSNSYSMDPIYPFKGPFFRPRSGGIQIRMDLIDFEDPVLAEAGHELHAAIVASKSGRGSTALPFVVRVRNRIEPPTWVRPTQNQVNNGYSRIVTTAPSTTAGVFLQSLEATEAEAEIETLVFEVLDNAANLPISISSTGSASADASVIGDITGIPSGVHTARIAAVGYAADGSVVAQSTQTITVGVDIKCPAGTQRVSGVCEACPAGTFSTDASNTCTDCPTDTFQAATGQQSCTQCSTEPGGQWIRHEQAGSAVACEVCPSDAQINANRDGCECQSGFVAEDPAATRGDIVCVRPVAELQSTVAADVTIQQFQLPIEAEWFVRIPGANGVFTVADATQLGTNIPTARAVALDSTAALLDIVLAPVSTTGEVDYSSASADLVVQTGDSFVALSRCTLATMEVCSLNFEGSTGSGSASLGVRIVVDLGLQQDKCRPGQEQSPACESSEASFDLAIAVEDVVQAPHIRAVGDKVEVDEGSTDINAAPGVTEVQSPSTGNVAAALSGEKLYSVGLADLPHYYVNGVPAAVSDGITWDISLQVNVAGNSYIVGGVIASSAASDEGLSLSSAIDYERAVSTGTGSPFGGFQVTAIRVPIAQAGNVLSAQHEAALTVTGLGETFTLEVKNVFEAPTELLPANNDLTMVIEENSPSETLVSGQHIVVVEMDSVYELQLQCAINTPSAAAGLFSLRQNRLSAEITEQTFGSTLQRPAVLVGIFSSGQISHEDPVVGADGTVNVDITCTYPIGGGATDQIQLSRRVVSILDKDEMPSFLGFDGTGALEASVEENSEAFTVVGRITVKDEDDGAFGDLQFGLQDTVVDSGDADSFSLSAVKHAEDDVTVLSAAELPMPSGSVLASEGLGETVSNIGDVDGDGVVDLAVWSLSRPDVESRLGAVHLLFMNSDGSIRATQLISSTSGGSGIATSTTSRFGAYPVGFSQPQGDEPGLMRLAVGQYGLDVSSIFIFRLASGGTVQHQVTLVDGSGGLPAGTLGQGDRFGASLTSPGDVDGDGLNDLVVGAPFVNAGRTLGGALFVLLLRADDTVKQVRRLSQASGEGFDSISPAVAQIGFACAAMRPRTAGNPVDLAVPSIVHNRLFLARLGADSTVLGLEEISNGVGGLPSGTVSPGSQFGYGVSAVGDIDQDGQDDLLMPIRLDGTGGRSSGGFIILFLNPGSSAVPVKAFAKFTSADPILRPLIAPGSIFGPGAAAGDFNSDGTTDLIVGARGAADRRGKLFKVLLDASPVALAGTSYEVTVKVAEGADLDYETQDTYAVTLSGASGSGAQGASADLTITLVDVLEGATFPETANTVYSVAENSAAGTQLTGAVAVGVPGVPGAAVTYSLGAQSPVRFAIDASTGQLSVANGAALDFEQDGAAPLPLTIIAQDPNGPPAELEVTVQITDENEAPVVSLSATEATVPENSDQVAGTVLAQVSVSDVDASDAQIGFSDLALSCDQADRLQLQQSTQSQAEAQVVYVTSNPEDFEALSTVECTVTGTDSAGLQSTAPFTLRISDENDAPQTGSSYSFTLEENQPAGTIPEAVNTAVTATDQDAGDVLTFNLAAGAPFIMDSTTGQLTYVGDGEDYEALLAAGGNYEIDFTVTDSAGATATGEVRIDIIDVNEAPVLLGAGGAPRTIAKDAELGAAVSGDSLSSQDEDLLDDPALANFEVSGCTGSACGAFGFSPSSDGTIRLVDPSVLDLSDGAAEAVLTIRVRDRQDASQALYSETGEVTIVVECPEDACPEGTVGFGGCSRTQTQVCVPLSQPEPPTPGDDPVTEVGRGDADAGTTGVSIDVVPQNPLQLPGSEYEASRDEQCKAVVRLQWGAAANAVEALLEPVRFFRITTADGSSAVVGLAREQSVDVQFPAVSDGNEGSVSVERVSTAAACIDSVSGTISSDAGCFTPETDSSGSAVSVTVGTRCFCASCEAGSFQNPVCEADTVAAFQLSNPSDWCSSCRSCSGQEYETRSCLASNPQDVGYDTAGAAFLDRECAACTQCEYDEFEMSSCGGDDGRTDRVCMNRVLDGFPIRREDGSTGARGRLYPGFSNNIRNADCNVELRFVRSDRNPPAGSDVAWYRVRETRRSNVRFSYVFGSRNHQETRLVLGSFPNQDMRFELSYLRLNTRAGETMPAARPSDDDARWTSVNSVDVGTQCVETFTAAEEVETFPRRSVRTTGHRGRMENAFDLQQRDSQCNVLADVRYVCGGDDFIGQVCAQEQTFLIRETRRSNIRFAKTVTLRAGTETRVNLGTFPNQDVRFTLFHSDGNGGWRRTNDIDVRTGCVETFEEANVISVQRSDSQTGNRGRIFGAFGQKRASNGDVLVRVRYHDDVGPDTDRFVIRETRRSNIRFAREITLQNGQEALVNLGQFPNQDIRFGLFYEREHGRADWRQCASVDIRTERVETFELAAYAEGGAPRATTKRTGSRGRIEGVYGNRRAPDCSTRVIVRYNDRHDCENESRHFVIRETRRSNIRFSREVVLNNGYEAVLDLGQFPNMDVRIGLFYERTPGHWEQCDSVDIRTECTELFDDPTGAEAAHEVLDQGGDYDAHTGRFGRIMQLWGTKRAGANSGLVSFNPISGVAAPVQEGDVIVRLAYNANHGNDPNRLLIRETRRSNVRFAKSAVLRDGEEKWLNLGQFPNMDVRFTVFRFDQDKGWLAGNSIDIRTDKVETFENAALAVGYPRENHRHSGSRAVLDSVIGRERLCDGSIPLHVRYCEDERFAPASRTFVLRETRRSNVRFSKQITLANCNEAVVLVPGSDIPNQDVRFQIFDSDGEGGWYSYGNSVDVGTSKDADVCPADLAASGARRAQAARGSVAQSVGSIGGGIATTRVVLPPMSTIQATVDPLALSGDGATSSAAVLESTGSATAAQVEGMRASAQAALRADVAEQDPELAQSTSIFVNANAESGELVVTVLPESSLEAVASIVSASASSAGRLSGAMGLAADEALLVVVGDQEAGEEQAGDEVSGAEDATGPEQGTSSDSASEGSGSVAGMSLLAAGLAGAVATALVAIGVAAAVALRHRAGAARSPAAVGSAAYAAEAQDDEAGDEDDEAVVLSTATSPQGMMGGSLRGLEEQESGAGAGASAPVSPMPRSHRRGSEASSGSSSDGSEVEA